MTEKNTTPTDKPLHASNRGRTNNLYWADVDHRTAASKEEPTVQDRIEAMCAEGNTRFMRDYGFHEKHVQQPFPDVDYVRHEIAHICPRVPHTPQMEYAVMAFEYGSILGIRARNRDAGDLRFKKLEFDGQKGTQNFFKEFVETTYLDKYGEPYINKDRPHVPLSKRDTAVYVAAGMYMREKIDAFLKYQQQLKREERNYPDQKAWCASWAKTDCPPVDFGEYLVTYDWPSYFNDIKKAPESLLAISDTEWRAIKAVALGIQQPEQTDYPQRMGAIKQALEKTALLFDKPKFAEQLKAEQAEKARRGAAGRGAE